MHHAEGDDAQIAYHNRLVGANFVQLDGRDTRIAMLGKTVRQHLQHALAGNGIGIDVDFAKLTIGADVVHASHVVVVGMSDENGVDLTEWLRHDLLAEIGTTINQHTGALCLYEC